MPAHIPRLESPVESCLHEPRLWVAVAVIFFRELHSVRKLSLQRVITESILTSDLPVKKLIDQFYTCKHKMHEMFIP